MQYLTIWDLLLTPVFILILTAIARNIRDKRYPVGHLLRRYYMPALYVKIGGAIFIALIYQYYYGGGDTYNYYSHAKLINSSLNDSFSIWFKLITRQSPVTNPEIYWYVSQLVWYNDTASYTVAVIAAILGLFTATTYMPTALLFAFFSFTGVWAMYRTFVNLYPKLHKELAIAFLFIPSTFVWGSAIFKDTLCMFGLGWMVYTTFRLFINKDFSFKNIGMLVLSFYLVANIKMYILLGFLPALSLWLLMTYSRKVKTVALRWVINLSFLGINIISFFYISQKFAEELGKYSLDNVAQTAAVTREWISYASGDEGSAYDLGEFDPSIGGMLGKFPQAVVVTLFRPFPWEARKVIVLLSALEALAFVFFTLWAFKTNGLSRSLKLIAKDPNVLFFLVFSLIFAFAVGISSYNFGALSRYKIPCLPFYAAFIMLVLHHKNIETPKSSPQVKSFKKEPA